MILKEKDFIDIENSKTDYNILRKNLTHYLLKILSENTDSEYPQKIFEIGKVFQNKEGKVCETENLSVAISPGNFTDIKQILENFSKMINIKLEFNEIEENPNYFINGRTLEILLEDKKIGFIGEIHPKILKNWKIKMPVSLFELELKEIFGRLTHPK